MLGANASRRWMLKSSLSVRNDMSSDNSFEKQLKDGTTIHGDKSMEGRPGYKHGHSGPDFDRSQHSTIGSTAVDSALGSSSPGHTSKDHPTNRS
jgi:hypothetical protein